MSGAVKAATMGGRGVRPGPGSAIGDPGIFGAIGGALKGGFRSLVTGGNPLFGAAAGARTGFAGVPVSNAIAQRGGSGFGAGPGIALPKLPFNFPFGPRQTGTDVVTTGGGPGTAVMPVQPAGHHLNKTSYFLIDGTFVPARSRWVKNRRRNPLNPRALRRAISRIDAGKIWQGKPWMQQPPSSWHLPAGCSVGSHLPSKSCFRALKIDFAASSRRCASING